MIIDTYACIKGATFGVILSVTIPSKNCIFVFNFKIDFYIIEKIITFWGGVRDFGQKFLFTFFYQMLFYKWRP